MRDMMRAGSAGQRLAMPNIRQSKLALVCTGTGGDYMLRPLGLINGLFGVDSDAGFIAMIVDADGAIERFERLAQ